MKVNNLTVQDNGSFTYTNVKDNSTTSVNGVTGETAIQYSNHDAVRTDSAGRVTYASTGQDANKVDWAMDGNGLKGFNVGGHYYERVDGQPDTFKSGDGAYMHAALSTDGRGLNITRTSTNPGIGYSTSTETMTTYSPGQNATVRTRTVTDAASGTHAQHGQWSEWSEPHPVENQ